ncbi:MAG TPA: BON domain-containing protein [Terracidiphilus sp.]|jgi:osmotically-inducible protein OsmY
MTKTMRTNRTTLLAATLAGALLSLPQIAFAGSPATGLGRWGDGAAPGSGATAQAQAGGPVATDAAARLNKKQYRNVTVNVDNGIATLTGTVDLFEYKADAEKSVRKAKGVTAVRDLIEVAGPTVSDQELQAKLGEKLAYDRVGYGNVFDAITLQVHSGAVTLGGHAKDYPDRDSALALVSTYPGVKDVEDEIQVDPVSTMDWQTRMAVARAVYGYPSLNRYAIDPVKPIRISVQNGNVELYGTVDSQSDKDTAFLRANGVPGVFSVKNYLQVANQPSETQKK